MWLDDYSAACRRCADLVAVYESARGQLALLLHHTLVPVDAERRQWRTDTRRAARIALGALRRAGVPGRTVVLQWIAVRDAATIMHAWRCRYDADPARRSQLAAVASRFAQDEHFLASRAAPHPETGRTRHDCRPPFATSAVSLRALGRWYDTMAPCWLAMEPGLRCALVMRSQRWLADHVLLPAADGLWSGLNDPKTCVALERALMARVPADETADWRPWIRRLGALVERALRQPVTTWDCAWARALLLIPVAIPNPVGSAAPLPSMPALGDG